MQLVSINAVDYSLEKLSSMSIYVVEMTISSDLSKADVADAILKVLLSIKMATITDH